MITNIITSFDEALKLEATLISQEPIKETFERHIIVYSSGNKNKEAHIKVLNDNYSESDKIYFIEDKGGLKQTIDQIFENTNNDLSMLTMAGDIFRTDKIDEGKIAESFKEPKMFCFSLRLGENIKKNSMVNIENQLVPLKEDDGIIFWDWHKHYIDFSAPLSVHCHIFKTKDIRKLAKNSGYYDDMDTLEENLQSFNNFPKNVMSSFKESAVCTVRPIFDPKQNTTVNALMNKQLFEEERKFDINIPENVEELHFDPDFEKLVNLYSPKEESEQAG